MVFRQVRYQTGEAPAVADEMKNGRIPCLDVDDREEFDRFVKELNKYGISRADDIPFDKNARDGIKEPEFEFRAAFYPDSLKDGSITSKDIMYIDVYFEPEIERTYDSVGEM